MAKDVWERRFQEHACWAKLNHAAEVLSELDVDDVDGDAEQQLARARRAVSLVQEMKSDADPIWVGGDTMGSIETAAAALVTAADQFSTTDNEAHLSQLSDPSDSLVRAARHLVPPELGAVTRTLTEEVEQGRQAVKLLQDEVSRARAEAEEQEAATRTRLSESADVLEQRLTETTAVLESTKQEIDALTTEDREQREARFKTQMGEQESKLREKLTALESQFQERMNSAQESADEVLAEVKRRREEVENEAGAVAVSALGGRLGQTADREDARAFG